MKRNTSRVIYSRIFEKQIINAPLKIKEAFRKRRLLFQEDPSHLQLHNHQLTGKFKGFRSINITGDWRAIYSEKEGRKVIIFELLGTHSQLYK